MSSVADAKMMEGAVSGAASGAVAGSVVPGIGTAIGAGVGLLGGVLSNMSHEKQADRGYAEQREALQHGISWRVADAKAAGIHPLYALGSPPMSVAPIVTQDAIGPAIQQMGQSMTDISRSTLNEQQKATQFAELQVLGSQRNKNDAEAELARVQSHVLLQKQGSNINAPGLGVQPEHGQNPTGGGVGMIDLKPAEQISTKTGMPMSSAGVNPAYQLRYLENGLPMYLPIAEGDSPEETISEMHPLTWAGLIAKNSRIFGPGWAKDLIQSRYLGLRPTGKYDPNAKDTGPDWEDELRAGVGKYKQKMIDKTGEYLMPYGAKLPQIRIEKRKR